THLPTHNPGREYNDEHCRSLSHRCQRGAMGGSAVPASHAQVVPWRIGTEAHGPPLRSQRHFLPQEELMMPRRRQHCEWSGVYRRAAEGVHKGLVCCLFVGWVARWLSEIHVAGADVARVRLILKRGETMHHDRIAVELGGTANDGLHW